MNNELMIEIPSDFRKMNTLPEDPPNSLAYSKQTQVSNIFLIMYPINNQQAMPYGKEKGCRGMVRQPSRTVGLCE